MAPLILILWSIAAPLEGGPAAAPSDVAAVAPTATPLLAFVPTIRRDFGDPTREVPHERVRSAAQPNEPGEEECKHSTGSSQALLDLASLERAGSARPEGLQRHHAHAALVEMRSTCLRC